VSAVVAMVPAAAAVGCPRCGAAVALPVAAGLGEARVCCGRCANSFLSGDGRPAVTAVSARGLAPAEGGF